MVKKICKYCGKEFNGINDKQVDTQLAIHKLTQHPNKVKLMEVKNESTKKSLENKKVKSLRNLQSKTKKK